MRKECLAEIVRHFAPGHVQASTEAVCNVRRLQEKFVANLLYCSLYLSVSLSLSVLTAIFEVKQRMMGGLEVVVTVGPLGL